MAKIKDLAVLNEGDRIKITDIEFQLNETPALVRDTLIPDESGVEWIRCQAEIGDSYKIVTLYQSDVSAGITIIERE